MQARAIVSQRADSIVSPWTSSVHALRSPNSAPANAADTVEIQQPPALGQPSVEVTASAARPLSKTSRVMIIGAVALAVAGAMGGGVVLTQHTGPACTSVGQTLPVKATASDRDVLQALDKGGQLLLNGRPTDGYTALQALESGKEIGVAIPRMGYHANAHIDDPEKTLTIDDVKTKQDGQVAPAVIQIRTFEALRRVNAAEKLTDVDTSASLTQAEKDMLAMLLPLEGGVPTSHISQEDLASGGVRFYYGSDMPQPAIFIPGHHRGFRPSERLSALDAVQCLSTSKPVAVISPSGLEQTIRKPSQLGALNRLEAPRSSTDVPDPKTAREQDLQEEIVRELAAAKQLQAEAASQDIKAHQLLTGFQTVDVLNAGEPVIIQLGNGPSGTVRSLHDLALFNAEEGLTKVDGSALLSARDLQTSVELRTYEGRTTDSQQASLFGTRPSYILRHEVPSSERLNVHDARARLTAGKTLAVRTHRGQVHLIHNVDELDTLAKLVPAPPPPSPAAPGTQDPSAPQPTVTPNP